MCSSTFPVGWFSFRCKLEKIPCFCVQYYVLFSLFWMYVLKKGIRYTSVVLKKMCKTKYSAIICRQTFHAGCTKLLLFWIAWFLPYDLRYHYYKKSNEILDLLILKISFILIHKNYSKPTCPRSKSPSQN